MKRAVGVRYICGTTFIQSFQVKTSSTESLLAATNPCRSSAAARNATPYVLMRTDNAADAVRRHHAEQRLEVCNVLGIHGILWARTGVRQRLPGN